MQDQKNRLIDKIKALFALSKSPNQAEAELALAKANELMEKYQISLTEISEKDLGEVAEEHYVVGGVKVKYHFISFLAQASAELYGATVLHTRKLGVNEFFFVGYPNDIEAAKATFEYLWGAWAGICELDLVAAKTRARIDYRTWAPKHTMTFKHSHGNGFVMQITKRVKELVESRNVKVSEESPVGRQLIVLKDNGVSNFIKKQNVSHRDSRLPSRSGDGYHAGKIAGNSVPLSAVSGSSKSKQITKG